MKPISTAFKAHIQGEVTTVCVCIAITRRDKAVYALTDHDMPVTFNATRFLPYNSFSRASIANTCDLEVDGLEINGILNSDALAREDIDSGLFDFAEVDVYLVNYADTTMGAMSMRRGWLGEIETNEDGTFHAEVRGMSQIYTYRIGDPYAPECITDLGSRLCKIGLDPDFWKAGSPYRAGDFVIGHITAANNYVNASMINNQFADEVSGTTARLASGWVTFGGQDGNWHFSDNWQGLGPAPGASIFAGVTDAISTTDTTELGMYQDVDLVASGLTTEDIDSGLCRAHLTGWVAVITSGGRVRMSLTAIGADAKQRVIWDSGLHSYALLRWITLRADHVLIPQNTRTIRVSFYGQKAADEAYGSAFGGCQLSLNDPSGTFGSDLQANGVMFQAQTSGVTGTAEPAFTTELGATFTDGGVTWKCVKSFKDVSTVTGTISNQEFEITLPQSAGYYDGGLAIWETGKNAGRAQEIKTWADGVITFFDRTFYPIAIGDRIVIHPGCDKRRPTCIDKFNNILNFRGFPDVPGQDAFMQRPETHSS